MPKTVGAWLCGLYDSDRAVIEATQNSLRQVFNTPEKIQNIRRAYQQPILEYCRDAIDKETSLTLSDERTVSPDDAEAKYSRVISACVALLGSLLANLQSEELFKYQSEYDGLLGDKKLWEFASHGDVSIRRSIHRFLKTCLAKQPSKSISPLGSMYLLTIPIDAVQSNLETISKSFLANALNSDQTGSAFDYIDAIDSLTSAYPTVWTDHYKSKTTADRRLRQFLKKGSQYGPRDFWDRLVHLFGTIPKDVRPTNAADAAEMLSSLHAGITRKDESRLSLESAFSAYLDIATSISMSLSEADQRKLLSELLLPIVTQYLRPTPENSSWNVPQNSTRLLAKTLALGSMAALLQEQWPSFAKQLINDIKTSAPEQSKDYERSQDALRPFASRFAIIQEQGSKVKACEPLRSVFVEWSASLISEALSVIVNRNGKPYGATGVVAELIHRNREIVFADERTVHLLEQFIREDLPKIILSPSSTALVDVLYSFSDTPSFGEAWTMSLKTILKAPDSTTKTKALEAILTSSRIPKTFSLASEDPELQQYIKSSVNDAIEGAVEWDAFNRMLQSPSKVISSDTTNEILANMTESLSLTQKAPYALQGLRQIVKQNPSMLKAFLTTPKGPSLLQGLLLASESPNDEISQDATAVNASIQTILAAGSDTKQSVFNLVQQGLKEAAQTSVSIETLVDLAKQLVEPQSSWDDAKGVLPNVEDWNLALTPFLDSAPRSSLAIANPLGGAVYLVEANQVALKSRKLPRDADGFSAAYRIAQYVTKLSKEGLFSVKQVPGDLQGVFLRNLALTIQLADDNLGLAGANWLWAEYNADVEADAISFISDAQGVMKQELERLRADWSTTGNTTSLTGWATELLAQVEPEASAKAYYTARAYSVLISDAIEICGWKNSQTTQIQEILKTIRKSKEIFPLHGFLNAFREPLAASKSCERMCNEIVADLTGLNIEMKPEEGLRQLVLLNTLLYGQEEMSASIAKQRLVFFVKHIIPWIQGAQALPSRAEVCRILTVLLPLMSDLYGEHWGSILAAVADSWSGTEELEENESGMDRYVVYNVTDVSWAETNRR